MAFTEPTTALQSSQVVSLGCGFSRSFMVENPQKQEPRKGNRKNPLAKLLNRRSSSASLSPRQEDRSFAGLVEAGKFRDIIELLQTSDKATIRPWLRKEELSLNEEDEDEERRDGTSSTMGTYTSDISSAGYDTEHSDTVQAPRPFSTALHTLFKGTSGPPPPTAVDLVIEHLSDLHVMYIPQGVVDSEGRTPLHVAAAHNTHHASLLRLLKSDTTSAWLASERDNDGRTPLHWAAAAYASRQSLDDATNFLLNVQALVDDYPYARSIKDHQGKTPLDLLPPTANSQTIELLRPSSRRRDYGVPQSLRKDDEVPRMLLCVSQSREI